MCKAKYVVTDAFHGAVFSLIFNREFFVEISEYGKDTGSRITNILEIYNLQGRLLTPENKDKIFNEKPIDYDIVNKQIKREQKEAEETIIQILENKFGGGQNRIIYPYVPDLWRGGMTA